MVDDNKRREVAQRLREARTFISILPNTIPEQSAYDAFKLILACVGYERGNVFDILADLIDRPTCKMESHQEVLYGRCSLCGAFVRRDVVTDCTGGITVKYCPNCGADVVK